MVLDHEDEYASRSAAILSIAQKVGCCRDSLRIWVKQRETPPVIWAMCIGLPSPGKSPAIDAAVQPLMQAERPLREAAEAEARGRLTRLDCRLRGFLPRRFGQLGEVGLFRPGAGSAARVRAIRA